MQVKIDAITKIQNYNKSTYYFLEKNKKILLPIDYIDAKSKNIEDIYIRTLNALNVDIERITIYMFLNNRYYCYIRIKNEKNNYYDIHTSISNALNILELRPNILCFIDYNILKNQGLPISKEIINLSLSV